MPRRATVLADSAPISPCEECGAYAWVPASAWEWARAREEVGWGPKDEIAVWSCSACGRGRAVVAVGFWTGP